MTATLSISIGTQSLISNVKILLRRVRLVIFTLFRHCDLDVIALEVNPLKEALLVILKWFFSEDRRKIVF